MALQVIDLIIVADGGCKGQHQKDLSKRQAYGSFAVVHNGAVRKVERFELPDAKTSPQAEWSTMVKALEYARDLSRRCKANQVVKLTVQMDSKNVIGGMTTDKVSSPNIKPMHQMALNVIGDDWGKKAGGAAHAIQFEKVERDLVVSRLGH